MELGHAAELVRLELLHLPGLREDVEQGHICSTSRSRVLNQPLEPCKSSLSILKARVRLQRAEELLVWLKQVSAEPDP